MVSINLNCIEIYAKQWLIISSAQKRQNSPTPTLRRIIHKLTSFKLDADHRPRDTSANLCFTLPNPVLPTVVEPYNPCKLAIQSDLPRKKKRKEKNHQIKQSWLNRVATWQPTIPSSSYQWSCQSNELRCCCANASCRYLVDVFQGRKM